MTLIEGASVNRLSLRLLAALFLVLAAAVSPALAQDDDPAALRVVEPDYTIVNLPTSLRLPTHKSAFRVTHRFSRTLNDDFDEVASDLFGLDSGATIGLEYRYGIIKNGQIGIHRSSNAKTVEFFGEYSLWRQTAGKLFDVSALASVEAVDNFQEAKSPALGAVISKTVGDVAAFYVEPIWVNNANPLPSELADDNSTFFVGVGARIRIRPTVYVVGEVAPNAGGYDHPGTNHAAFAIEKRIGGHSFQLSFATDSASTMAQIARGGGDSSDWYLGFHISRKFF
jgi:hypothetical protein